MDSIITATFNDYTYARTTSLWQYDYGQILQIEGITLPTTFEVHFSNQDREGESLIQIGSVKDKTAQVQIPDSFLRKAAGGNYSIYAFIYITDDESGETKYKITIPVRARPKPNTDLVDAPEEKKFFREAIEEVNNAADRAEKASQEAKDSAEEVSEKSEQAKKEIDDYVKEKHGSLKGDTGNVFFAAFKVVKGRLKMYSDPTIDKVNFKRIGSRLKYRLKV